MLVHKIEERSGCITLVSLRHNMRLSRILHCHSLLCMLSTQAGCGYQGDAGKNRLSYHWGNQASLCDRHLCWTAASNLKKRYWQWNSKADRNKQQYVELWKRQMVNNAATGSSRHQDIHFQQGKVSKPQHRHQSPIQGVSVPGARRIWRTLKSTTTRAGE